MQPKASKCLCAQMCCRFRQSGAHSCLTRQRRPRSNCAIEVSQVDWDRYIQTRRDNAMQLLASLYSSATSQCLSTVLSFSSPSSSTLCHVHSRQRPLDRNVLLLSIINSCVTVINFAISTSSEPL